MFSLYGRVQGRVSCVKCHQLAPSQLNVGRHPIDDITKGDLRRSDFYHRGNLHATIQD